MCTLIESTTALVSEGASLGAAATISDVLARFGVPAIRFAIEADIRIVPLSPLQRYRDASTSLRRLGVDVDSWPVPPAGLFVVEERAIYLRSASPMTVAHEFGHALDCALGGGIYRSSYDPEIRRAFHLASEYVTPYAASGLDEYFAESLRAYVEVNDTHSPWPKATRERLAGIDPAISAFFARLFANEFSGDLPAAPARS
jgi:hypothetical protein